METDSCDPHRRAYDALMEAAAWLHSIGTAPRDTPNSILHGDALAAAGEVMDLIDAYPHLWPPPPTEE